MSRWGEEESKTKGLLGFFIWFLIVSVVGYTFYHNYTILEDRRNVEKIMQNAIRTAPFLIEEPELSAKIMSEAEDLNIELLSEDIYLLKSKDDFGNVIWEAKINFPMSIDLYIYKFDFNLPIKETVTRIY